LPEDPTDLSKGIKFDPADDILNASKVSDYIYTQILPALKEEALKVWHCIWSVYNARRVCG
jgi:hypothetical protein